MEKSRLRSPITSHETSAAQTVDVGFRDIWEVMLFARQMCSHCNVNCRTKLSMLRLFPAGFSAQEEHQAQVRGSAAFAEETKCSPPSSHFCDRTSQRWGRAWAFTTDPKQNQTHTHRGTFTSPPPPSSQGGTGRSTTTCQHSAQHNTWAPQSTCPAGHLFLGWGAHGPCPSWALGHLQGYMVEHNTSTRQRWMSVQALSFNTSSISDIQKAHYKPQWWSS